jgi:hypothetical protein
LKLQTKSVFIYKTTILYIIIEGKKEESAKLLKQKFEYDHSFIDSVLNTDPTGYKYIDYIVKQLEKWIPEFSGSKGGLNYLQGQALYNVFEDIIPWFHNNSGRITSEFLKQARDIYVVAMDKDVENFETILKSPKDITNYPLYFIQTLRNIVEENKSRKEIEKEAKSQVEKLYEDDTYLVLKPKTYEASCYYGSGTKWCTSSKDTKEHFRKYSKEGNLYYFINKKYNIKFALFKEHNLSGKQIFDAQDKEITSDILLENFPLDITEELLGGGLFKLLVGYAKGKVLKQDIYSTEEMIRSIKDGKPLGSSEVIIDFENDNDFYNVVGIDDEDENFIGSVFSSYDSWEFEDRYQTEESFREGYAIYDHLDEENVEKLSFISSLILSDESFDLKNENFRTLLSRKLLEIFPKEIDYIISDYTSEYNYMMNNSAKDKIRNEIENFLEQFHFKVYSPFGSITTTVGNLVMWYVRLGLERFDLYNLMKKIFDSSKKTIGGFVEDQYSFEDQEYFDKISFNNYTSSKLDDIIEKLQDKLEDGGVNVEEFLKMVENVKSKFKPNTWLELPKNRTINFMITGFDIEDSKINVKIFHPKLGSKSTKLSEQNFYYLLYQPELFKFGEV